MKRMAAGGNWGKPAPWLVLDCPGANRTYHLEDTTVTPAQIKNALEDFPIKGLQEIIFIKGGDIVVP